MSMRYDSPEWENLNAYIDGELVEADARALESRLATDPDLRQELDRLRDVKDRLTRMRPSLTEAAPPLHAHSAAGFRKYYAIAASLVVAVVLSTIGVLIIGSEPAGWLQQARTVHTEQSQRAYIVEERYIPQMVSSGQALEFPAPDLTASRLYLVDISTRAWNDRETIAMHYRGLRGCRLTLVAIEESDDDDKIPQNNDTGSLIRNWTHAGFEFLIIADGMDPDRFASVAAYTEIATIGTVRANDRMQTAMAETQREARPCA
jgi:anti-sigma factor RsiW